MWSPGKKKVVQLFLLLSVGKQALRTLCLPLIWLARMTMLTDLCIQLSTLASASGTLVCTIRKVSWPIVPCVAAVRMAAKSFLRLAPTVLRKAIVLMLCSLFRTTWLGCRCRATLRSPLVECVEVLVCLVTRSIVPLRVGSSLVELLTSISWPYLLIT